MGVIRGVVMAEVGSLCGCGCTWPKFLVVSGCG